MSACRGIVVGSNTNRARTVMAECFLRTLSGGNIFVCSGGVRTFGGPGARPAPVPMVVDVMREMGLDVAAFTSTSLASAVDKIGTFDVFVSIDSPPESKLSPEEDHWAPEDAATSRLSSSTVQLDDMLAPPTPAHWRPGADASSVVERWTVWSPRNPQIQHENSIRKLQDHLYEGEPLFRTMEFDNSRQQVRWQERWVLPPIGHPYAMERTEQYRQRVRRVRNAIFDQAEQLLLQLQVRYDCSISDVLDVERRDSLRKLLGTTQRPEEDQVHEHAR